MNSAQQTELTTARNAAIVANFEVMFFDFAVKAYATMSLIQIVDAWQAAILNTFGFASLRAAEIASRIVIDRMEMAGVQFRLS